VVALLAMGVQAQTFPSPYCELTDDGSIVIEEITNVSFADTNIDNSDTTVALVDKTEMVIDVIIEETYTLEVSGNTEGAFDTNIVAFIDWNQNDVLDDAGEVYTVGTLYNTNGTDGVSVSLDITVPTDAVLGETRVRISKTYTDFGNEDYPASPAVIDACGIMFDVFGLGVEAGYGQALDFTLSLETLSTDEFELNALAVYPNPAQDVLNIDYKSTLAGVKVYNIVGQEVLSRMPEVYQLQLDISAFTSGIYIVKLFTEEGQHSFRVVKD